MSRFLPRSLGGQLVALLLAGLVLAQVLTIVVFFDERRQAIRAARQLGLLERIASIVRLIEATPPALHDRILATVGSSRIRFAIAGDSALEPSDGGPRAQRLTASLEELLPPGRRQPARLGLSDDAGGGPGRRFAVWGGIRDRQRVNLTVSVPLAHGGWLNVATHFRPHRTGWAWPYMVSMLLMAATILVVVALTVRRITRPLTALSHAADRLGRGDSVEPLVETGPREVRRTTAAFNAMQARLTRFVRDRTAMLAAISHDLRTPITSMRLRAELVEDRETKAKLLEALEEMQRMTEATLAFAREEAMPEETRPVDLAALVQSLCEDLAETGMEVVFRAADKTPYACRPLSLKRAIRNLIENAAAYGKRARVALEPAGAAVRIVVDDDGPGLPEEAMERVFTPFVRLEGSRSRETGGIGLGLAIARSVIRGHGGDITLANRAEGGLRATIHLPASAAAAAAPPPG